MRNRQKFYQGIIPALYITCMNSLMCGTAQTNLESNMAFEHSFEKLVYLNQNGCMELITCL